MAKNNKTRAQLEAELETLKNFRTSESVTSVANNAIRWTGLSFIAYCCYLSIDALAGQTTFANIAVNFLSKINVSIAIAWTFGLSGVLYGLSQCRLRKNTVERLQIRIKDLEKMIDYNRSSSQLTERGDTRPEDII